MWRQGEFRAAGARSAPKYHFRLTCGMSINENQPVVRLQSFLIACLWAIPATAGEGLWPYNQFPKDSVKQMLGFEVDSAFLDRLRLASVKLPAGATHALRNPATPRMEKECAAKSGIVCSVVRLFSGGRYDLYQYRRYSDLRLVFAPEYAIAFFGRERDSISYRSAE